jgi:hypothetical protein
MEVNLGGIGTNESVTIPRRVFLNSDADEHEFYGKGRRLEDDTGLEHIA